MNFLPLTAIGQDSHRFQTEAGKPLILGGISIDHPKGLEANSDGDVVLHAITNAVSGLTGVNILGDAADKMCLGQGIKDSGAYLKAALSYLGDIRLTHLSVSIECRSPKLSRYMSEMKASISALSGIDIKHIGITATTGEGLTACGRGEGISVMCVLSGIISSE